MKRGKFLAKLRIKAGLSQNDVAEKLNYSPQLVSLWEKDKAQPDLRIISKYAYLLNIDLKGFINCENKLRNKSCSEFEFDIDRFSNNLKVLRKEKKLLQSEIAKELGTNVKTIGAWENGLSTPSIDAFVSLCALFNKSYNELYFVIEDGSKYIDDKRRSRFFPIFLPIAIIASVGGITTGVTIGVTQMNNIKRMNSDNICEHQYSSSRIEPTFEKDGFVTYTCVLCGDTYSEELPHLVHSYGEEWSHDNHYHFHQCLDKGYEDLHKDEGEHSFEVTRSGDVTTYTCSVCEYSFSNKDQITVIDIYSESGDRNFSVSAQNSFYVSILNPTKYVLTEIGYVLATANDQGIIVETNGSMPISENGTYMSVLDVPNYTLFELKPHLINIFPTLPKPGNSFRLKFTTTVYDMNLKSVNCDFFDFNIVF